MKKLHVVGAAVVLALAAAPPPATAQQTRWYLAEGSTGPFFEEEVLAINPTDQTAAGIVRVYRDGAAVDVPIAIPPRRRITLPVNLLPGLATGETSALVDTSASGVPIFVEWTIYWNSRRGGHNAGGVEAPQTTRTSARARPATSSARSILLVNPNPSAVSVTVRLLSDDAAPVDFPYTVGGNSRLTIPVNNLPRFRSANFATVVTASQPVFVERAMYWLGFQGGHDATAVASLSTVWRFAEGFTGGDFETYFLLANTTGASISSTLSFFTHSGAVITKTVPIGPNSRRTVRVRDYPELVDAAFATTITASAPIVAERAMYGRLRRGPRDRGPDRREHQVDLCRGPRRHLRRPALRNLLPVPQRQREPDHDHRQLLPGRRLRHAPAIHDSRQLALHAVWRARCRT